MRVVHDEPAIIGATLSGWAVALILALIIMSFGASDIAVWALPLLGVLAVVLVVICHFRVHEDSGRRRFRLHFAALTAAALAILGATTGLRASRIDLTAAVVYGLIGGSAAHILAFLVGGAADLILDRVRRFAGPCDCNACGCDLWGQTAPTCPDCGADIPLLQQRQLAPHQPVSDPTL
jgi:hypothetical protein